MNTIESIICPPGKEAQIIGNTICCGHIEFNMQFDAPLPTLPQATYSNDAIVVEAVILIKTDLEELHLKVNQLFTISNYGKPQLQLFIYCDEIELERIIPATSDNNTYKTFTMTISVSDSSDFPQGIVLEDIKCVETFLWDIDPKTSRGTVTTVQTTN